MRGIMRFGGLTDFVGRLAAPLKRRPRLSSYGRALIQAIDPKDMDGTELN